MKLFNKHFTLFFLFIVGVSLVAIGQPSSPPATPIDGGLSLLLAAGGLYGIKQLRNKSKK